MQHLLDGSNEPVISFEIGEIFDQNNSEMDVINAEDLPPDLFNEIFETEDVSNLENEKETNVADGSSDGHVPRSRQVKENINSKRFKYVNEDQVDEIAGKSCKKKTHKQTTWGVKVFRGT